MSKVRQKDIPYHFERACLRKANLNEEEANSIIDQAVKERNLLLYYYKCEFCSSHHLTSKEPSNKIAVQII